MSRIVVIAPYSAQASVISKLCDVHAGKMRGVEIQVGTIHGFQGDECDAVIVVLNPPPKITRSPQMFLNKQNILNVAISRARDYLFMVVPDDHTDDIENLHKIARLLSLAKASGNYGEHNSSEIENLIFGDELYLENNTFATGHQMVNVYHAPERFYEVRSDDSAIDIQLHEGLVADREPIDSND